MSNQSLRLVLGIAAIGFASISAHDAFGAPPTVPFGVEFKGCVESIGVALAPTENVVALTPPGFIPVGIGTPTSPIVVRTADCAGISVDGGKSKPGSVVQIGAVIVPPAFTGEDIDNYTFWYYTSDEKLAHRLRKAGVSAQHVETIDYVLGPGTSGVPNHLAVVVPRPGDPRFAVAGTVASSVAPSGAFRAAWWQKTAAGNVRMDTTVPVIAIGAADLTLATRPDNALGALIGATTLGFPILQQFNVFVGAHMDVFVAP
jgi:hypothetical protein